MLSTSTTPSPISNTLTSCVPPPQSNTTTLPDPPLSTPNASAAAVGSLIIRKTSSPAIFPASLVAWRCASLKYAGTVMTACATDLPRYASAVSFILIRTCAAISAGLRALPCASIHASPLSALTTLYGSVFTSSATLASPNRRPIRRLLANTVLVGLVTAWRRAGCPTSCSLSVHATIDGVVRAPSEFSITFAEPPSIIATQLLVVPRSIPMILLIYCLLFISKN